MMKKKVVMSELGAIFQVSLIEPSFFAGLARGFFLPSFFFCRQDNESRKERGMTK